MNTNIVEQQNDELMTVKDTSQIVLDVDAMKSLHEFGKMMASGKSTVPKHLQGNAADCTAIAMQATQWRMNPFAVAQKTFLAPNGTLSYEAQLINAVITTNAPITGRPTYEFFGDWTKIQGKVRKVQPQGGDKGAYFVADWQPKDEEGLGVIVRCTLKGETEPRELTVLLVQCQPRFSTQWATDPQQQITYAAIRKWSRRYTPDVILGVYSEDEAQEMQPREVEINPLNANGAQAAQNAQKGNVIDPAQEQHREKLIKDLTKIAETQGVVAYGEVFLKLSKQDRQLIGTPAHEAMKAKAMAYDEAIRAASQAQQQAPTNPETQDFVEAMNQAEATQQQ